MNWSAGEPNYGGTSNVTEECVVNISFSGKWNDFPCDTKFNFICKMKAGQLRKKLAGRVSFSPRLPLPF